MMAVASLPPALPTLPLPARTGRAGGRPGKVVLNRKDNQSSSNVQQAQLRKNISRRDALSYMSSALLATFLVTNPAEARTSRQENKRKVREKLEKLRENAKEPKEKKNGSAGKAKGPPANLLIPPRLAEVSL